MQVLSSSEEDGGCRLSPRTPLHGLILGISVSDVRKEEKRALIVNVAGWFRSERRQSSVTIARRVMASWPQTDQARPPSLSFPGRDMNLDWYSRVHQIQIVALQRNDHFLGTGRRWIAIAEKDSQAPRRLAGFRRRREADGCALLFRHRPVLVGVGSHLRRLLRIVASNERLPQHPVFRRIAQHRDHVRLLKPRILRIVGRNFQAHVARGDGSFEIEKLTNGTYVSKRCWPVPSL